MLLSYLINVSQVAYNKVAGRSLVGEAAIDRLVEIRTVSQVSVLSNDYVTEGCGYETWSVMCALLM